MLTLHRPTDAALTALVERSRTAEFSYAPGLLHRVSSERRWFVDRHREVVGHGADDFLAAADALRHWCMFLQPWTTPAHPLAAIRTGETVGYSARAVGLWWSFCCRIVDTVDEPGRYGFDYGTVRGHAERGEERFLVELDPVTGEVTFELFAMSRPGRWYTWCGLPLARLTQAKFRPGASAAVRAFVDQARTLKPL